MANFNFNKVILGGRLTAKPELKSTQNGTTVCNFSIAIKMRDTTTFVDCVAWKTAAELISKYFDKGSTICIVGRLQVRRWEDQKGNSRKAVEVVVDEATFVDSKSEKKEEKEETLEEINPEELPWL